MNTSEASIDVEQRAADRHVEDDAAPSEQDSVTWIRPMPTNGSTLPIVSSQRRHRRRDQEFQVAALALAHDRHRREQHHRHGQDHADQARHGVDRRAPLRVVEIHNFHIRDWVGAGPVRRRCRVERMTARRRAGAPPAARLIRAVDDDLHAGRSRAREARLEIGRNHEGRADLAARSSVVDLLRRRRRCA